MKANRAKKRWLIPLVGLVLLSLFLWALANPILTAVGGFPVVDEEPAPSDAVVVLNTGMEYYPRLIEAAELFRKGFVGRIVINGNRKTEVLKRLERIGFEPCCPWFENRVRILALFGVPREKVIRISAEDAYDTVSEAEAVGQELLNRGYRRILIVTSKSHTRRARHIWKKIYGKRFALHIVSAKTDPYDPTGWWKDGRQIRWVLAEYGAWLYYWWKT
jgi:uncharacterized SAM-binding protein YcdF (DUF218 family)